MPTFIRLTDYKSSDAKEEGFFKSENRHEANQNDFEKIPGNPIAYWASKHIYKLFSDSQLESFQPYQGSTIGNNNRFLRFFHELPLEKINIDNWRYCLKGGEFRKWYGNHEYLVNWKNDGEEIKSTGRATIRNKSFLFESGISWSRMSSGFRIMEPGYFLESASGGCIVEESKTNIVLAMLNTKISTFLIKVINPTLHSQSGDIAKIPIISLDDIQFVNDVDRLVEENINISKEEWNSRETSWDFTKNELLKHKIDSSLKNSLNAYSKHWIDQFNILHTNEEDLNQLFIDIYGLGDELTPNVALEDITILKSEAKIVNGQLEFQNDEIIKQFISYAVGCMFGRYTLDEDGLVVANMNQDIPSGTTYEIDDDNIIPIVDESDYFSDDITDRFTEFVRTTFGSEKLQQNIAFIEKAISKKIRDYFMKEFYKDHVSTKRYKKRPIYWLFSSPKGTFQTLIYMHRYTPDTLNHILNDYLRPFRIRLDTMRNEAMRTTEREDVSSKEKADADKKIDKIDKTLDDINEYEKVLAHYAAQRIEIDLDDGVKVNYCKFKELLFEFDKKLCK